MQQNVFQIALYSRKSSINYLQQLHQVDLFCVVLSSLFKKGVSSAHPEVFGEETVADGGRLFEYGEELFL